MYVNLSTFSFLNLKQLFYFMYLHIPHNFLGDLGNITNYSSDQISSILEQKEVSLKERQQRGWEKISKVIACIDKETDKIIKVFSSIESAHKELKVRSSGHISAVCNGKRKTAYGYKWKYL